MTVGDLLKLNSLKGCRFVTDNVDEQVQVTGVNVMEVPDIFNWVNEGELLLTVGYSYRHRPEEFADILPRLKEKGVAVLGFKIHRFFEEIPDYIIDSAEKCGLPIIEISEDVVFSNVTREIIGDLLQGQVEKKYQDQFFLNWITGKFNNLSEFTRKAKDVDVDVDVNEKYIVLTMNMRLEMDSEQIRSLAYRIHRFLENESSLYITFDDENIIFVVAKSKCDSLINKIKETVMMISRRGGCTLYKGRESVYAYSLEDSYKTALNIEKICRSYKFDKEVIEYKDVGIYALFSLIPQNKQSEDFVKMYLGSILQYDKEHETDMLYTLRMYLENNANAKLTSEKMFMHYNTIGYRLDRIKQILNMDISDPEVQLCLLSAIKIHDMFL